MTIKPYLLTTILFLITSISVHGQGQSQYDKGTPPQLAAGVSSLGSYMSTELGTVNLSNGGLNINVPLGTVGGRGNVAIPLTLNYSSKVWSASMDVDTERESGTEQSVAYADYDNRSSFAGASAPGWTINAGMDMSTNFVRIKRIMSGPSVGCYTYGLHKLTLNFADRGEIEFRDDATDGAPLLLNCTTQQTTSRGTRWHATDGSGTIFINDVDNGVGLFPTPNLSGTVIFADGTRFGIGTNGGIIDRNGNKITRTFDGWLDQLGRGTTIQYGVSDPDNPSVTLAVLVTIPGYQGASRYYKIKTGIMNQNYRSDVNPTLPVITGDWDPEGWGYSWGTATRLFAKSYGLYAQRIDDREVLTEVVLPDGRSVKFRYNEFGEVAEIELPTGGKIQYDYAYRSSLPSGNSPSWETGTNGFGSGIATDVKWVDRAVTSKRTYPDGVNLEGTWTFGYGTHVIGSVTYPNATVSVTSNTSALLSKQRHVFLQAGRYTEPPPGGLSVHDGTHYTLWSTGVEWRTETLDAAGTVLAATERDWTQRAPVSWSTYPQEQPQKDNRVNQVRRYLETGMMAKIETLYDQYNNPTEVKEYDYDQTLKRRTVTSYLSTNNGFNYQTDDSIHLLGLPAEETVYDGSGNQVAKTVTEYDVYANDGNRSVLTGYPSVSQHDSNYGTSKTTRGNPTRFGTWLNTTGSFIYTYPRYDILGNVVSLKDARGNVSTVSFADDYGNGSNPGTPNQNPVTPTYAFPTLLTSPPPTAGAPVHTARSQYDYSTGLLTGFRDRNNVVTQTVYNDPFNRPTQVKAALGISGTETHSVLYYAPATTPFGITLAKNDMLTASDQTTLDDANLRSWNVTDGFGRTKETWTRDPQGNVKVTRIYDALSRTKQISNPLRPALGETEVYTTTAYDLLGRVTTVTGTDNSVVSTSYSANTVTVTDQALKKRKSVSDALGRLKEVYEDPAGLNYLTSYQYNTLNSLIKVTQGSQQRFFMYDSLKRLIRARNPEQGTLASLNLSDMLTGNSVWSMAYEYDAINNLTFKTDARGVVTENRYDTLNRVTTILYRVNGQPEPNTGDIEFLYDNAPNGKGRLWLTYRWGSKPSQTAVGLYDALGRATQLYNLFGDGQGGWSTGYPINRTYNRAGNVTSQTYPSLRTVSYAYDTAGRVNSFTGNLGDGVTRNYATEQNYSAFGALTKEKFGTSNLVYHKLHHNVRGQQCDVRASNVNDEWSGELGALVNFYSTNPTPCASGTDNNGNVLKSQTIINSYYMEDRYSYDSLNRLTAVNEYQNGSTQTGSQQYTYDRWGNRTINPATWGTGINNKQFTVDTAAATNRLGVPGGQSGTMSYDNAGNLTTDTSTGFGTRVFDADNKMVSAQDNLAGTSYYTYDANGQRVRRKSNNLETWQIYGIDGELVAEYAANGAEANPQKEYGYRNGQLLVTAAPATSRSFSGNGTSAYVQAPSSSSLNITGAITVEAWVKINAIGAYRAVISREAFQQSGTGGGYRLAITDTGKARLDLFQSHNTYVTLIGSTTITPGVWTHVAGVFDGSQMRVYLNGVQNGTLSTTSGPTSGTGNLHIGRFSYSFNPYYFNGLIDDARVSNAALYTSNFTPSNNLSATGSTKGLWKFDGQTANDSSGNGNNGTLQGGATYSTDVPGVGGSPQIQWLVSDHLGTPRIVIDQTGTLANVKRHDYLPFGEELFAGVGGRTTQLGYTPGDGVRQQFTFKERDNETNLDYFGARYYSSTQGRFTSADPLYIEMGRLGDPQQFNLYSYTRNNPLKFTDPLGLDIEVTGTEQEAYRKRLQQDVSFQTQINSKTNKVEIVDANGNVLDKKQLKALGKTLKGGEEELFNAITDTKHHVSIETGRNDSGVFFGAFGGGGKQKLDFGDIDLLDSPKNAGGFSAQQAVGHETLEAYAASKGKGYMDAHAYANKFFGGLNPPTTPGTPIFDANGANLTGVRADWSVVGRPGVNARITMQFVTPIPASAINTMFQTGQTASVHVVDVEKKP